MLAGIAFDAPQYKADPAYAGLLRSPWCQVYAAENAFRPSRNWSGPYSYNWAQADAHVALAQADGKAVRAPALYIPMGDGAAGLQWWKTAVNEATAFGLLVSYLQALFLRYPQVAWWDVLNEMFGGDPKKDCDAQGYKTTSPALSLWINAMGGGDALLKAALQTAQRCTTGKLFLCDNNTAFGKDSWHDMHRGSILGAIQRQRSAGLEVHFNEQGHLPAKCDQRPFPDFLYALKSLGSSLIVGELDVLGAANDQDAADTAAEFVDHIRASGIEWDVLTFWNGSDKNSWKAPDKPCPFDAQMQPKLMAKALGVA